jgi:hypothetical protein
MHPEDSRWPDQWAKLYDREGNPRYAVYVIQAASEGLNPDADQAFAAGFDAVADRIYSETGIRLGFVVDLLPKAHGASPGDCNGWQSWFAVGPGFASKPGAPVTALWHNSQHLDLFTSGADGTIWSTWWDANQAGGYRPQGWFAIHPEVKARPGATVTALWSNPQHLDLFMTDNDGTVWSTWWDANQAGGYRPQGWFAIHPEVKAQPGATITALWNNPQHLDLFMTGTDGTVWSTWWDANQAGGYRPQGWFAIHPEVKAQPGANVTALWRNSQHLDLFLTRTDGTVWSIWWDASQAGGYRPQGWFSIHSELKTVPGTTVTALWSNPQHLDLFLSGADGTVWSTWWDANEPAGYRPQGWFSIHSELKGQPGATMTALWSNPHHLDLFMTGTDGTVWSTWWDAGQTGGYRPQGWFAIHPEIKAQPGATVTALWSNAAHLDLFTTGASAVLSTWWQQVVYDTYVAQPPRAGPFLRNTSALLAVQAFIPEIWLGTSDEPSLVLFKQSYLTGWLNQGLPVIMDVSPGYDAHLVFAGSVIYGNDDYWRRALQQLWSAKFKGMAFNTWNGYTEGYAAPPTLEYGDATFLWLQNLFSAVQ